MPTPHACAHFSNGPALLRHCRVGYIQHKHPYCMEDAEPRLRACLTGVRRVRAANTTNKAVLARHHIAGGTRAARAVRQDVVTTPKGWCQPLLGSKDGSIASGNVPRGTPWRGAHTNETVSSGGACALTTAERFERQDGTAPR